MLERTETRLGIKPAFLTGDSVGCDFIVSAETAVAG
jgi:hypothetical protein